jgi:hypothetical protein
MESFNEVMIVAIIFFSCVSVVKIVSDNRLKRKWLERGPLDAKNVQPPVFQQASILSSLKWGFVLVGLGLALLIGQLMPSEADGEVILGGMFLLGGAGLVLFYYLANRMTRKSSK